tara:strand:+ start:250 stop:417 length:168 start_codon:yes stop_codon:yes gene_type:complete
MNINYKKLFTDVAKEHYESLKIKYDHTPTYTGKKLKPATRRKKYTKNNKGGLKDV